MKYVACCSFGKDSLATVILAKRHNEPLDAVVYARVMYDKNRSAELPEHENFIFNTAIPKLKSWGIETIVVNSPKTFLDCFYRVRSRGENVGRIVGFPIPNRCEVQRDCKLPSFKLVNDMWVSQLMNRNDWLVSKEHQKCLCLQNTVTQKKWPPSFVKKKVCILRSTPTQSEVAVSFVPMLLSRNCIIYF